MPVEALLDDPRALALPPAAYGMLCRLTHHFWLTECVDLPEGVNDLQAIARAHISTWARHRDEIRAILSDLIPAMRASREIRDDKLSRLASARAAQRAQEKAARPQGAALPLQSASHRQKRAESRLETITGAASRFRD